jgi:glutaminyl-tRNA synthetase
MPTISGLRRRGYTPEAIREFADRVGVAKRNNTIDVSLLEWALRDDLNRRAPRVMAVLNPIKLVVLNVPAEEVEWLQTVNNPEDPEAGSRALPFGRELWMEADDFKVDVNKKWFRLAPGRTVRLKSAYIVEYVDHIEDDQGQVLEVHVNRVANSKSGEDTSGVKAKGTLHWVASSHAIKSEVRLYDRLFLSADPEGGEDANFMNNLNPDSLQILSGCQLEPSLGEATLGTVYQFTRLGYFTVDSKYSKQEKLVFNRAVTLKDGWKG